MAKATAPGGVHGQQTDDREVPRVNANEFDQRGAVRSLAQTRATLSRGVVGRLLGE